MQKVLVIGAGIGGIAVAIRLALKGYDVTVYENHAKPGGKLSEIECQEFRFDAGPSLFTMPQFVDELFLLAKKNPADYFQYQSLEEVCRYFWTDGTNITANKNPQIFAEEVSLKTKSTAQELNTYLKNSAQIYDITHHVFLNKSLHKLRTYLSLSTLKSFLKINKIDALRNMSKANEHFFTDSKMVQYANRFATYNGSNPFKAPATLNVIPHLEQNIGAYFPIKGMYSIVESLVKLAEDLGVKFKYNHFISKILVEKNVVNGVICNNRIIKSNIVISNMDVYFTYKNLLSENYFLKKIEKQERSSSALIFYWGVKKEFKELGLHNILFSDDYKKEFKTIFEEKKIASESTIYIHISSKIKIDDAPKGCENWFVMVNVPNNSGQNWDELIINAKKNILSRINKQFNIELEKYIVCEDILDPRSIESKTYSFQGSLYGTSSNNRMAAFLRHPNFNNKINNLYFVGGSVHPGGGIPLCLLSAKITADLIPYAKN